ncbi:hypothetical protein LAZ67_13000226 [Cordylochernes scorpioides]|uniref:Mos1 transposase HTH domain-containing protein n=1 Tax=Cordylochernes scorpioides TaxID=51811 RepID=A0ABY6L2Q7_9ARAC|nr:hypothetical protein LAZ67_13000226 [Cordylochernes scorpioides]
MPKPMWGRPPGTLYRRPLKTRQVLAGGNQNIIEAWGEASFSGRTIRRWFQKFKVGDFGLEDQDGRGRRSTFKNEDLKSHIESNNTQTVCEVSAELNASKSTIAALGVVNATVKGIGKPPFSWESIEDAIRTPGRARCRSLPPQSPLPPTNPPFLHQPRSYLRP